MSTELISGVMEDQQMDPSLRGLGIPAAPQPSQRRPRTREVSSRFMSPSVKSSSSNIHSTPIRTQNLRSPGASTPAESQSTRCGRRRDSTKRRVSPGAHRVLHSEAIRNENVRSLDTLLGYHCNVGTPAIRKKLGFQEMVINDGKSDHQHRNLKTSVRKIYARSPSSLAAESIAPSASKLLRESSMSFTSGISDDDDDDRGSIENVSVSSDIGPSGASSPVNLLQTVKYRVQKKVNRRRGDALGISVDTPFSTSSRRSVEFAFSDSEMSPLRPSRVLSENRGDAMTDFCSFGVKTSLQCLPPLPRGIKVAVDAKKGKKAFGNQEDVHFLRMLQNHYLKWRFINAKSEVCVETQTREFQKMCSSIWIKILNLYESVKSKHMEIRKLQRINNAFYILQSQMPYLDEWTMMEIGYTNSFSQALEDLLNASLMLPLTEKAQGETRSLQDALASATSMMESCVLNIRDILKKNQELGCLASELAWVADGTRSFISESGDLLSLTSFLQVEECSFISHLIQQEAIQTTTTTSTF